MAYDVKYYEDSESLKNAINGITINSITKYQNVIGTGIVKKGYDWYFKNIGIGGVVADVQIKQTQLANFDGNTVVNLGRFNFATFDIETVVSVHDTDGYQSIVSNMRFNPDFKIEVHDSGSEYWLSLVVYDDGLNPHSLYSLHPLYYNDTVKIKASYDGSVLRLQTNDDIAEIALTVTLNQTSDLLELGVNNNIGSDYFNGTMHNFKIKEFGAVKGLEYYFQETNGNMIFDCGGLDNIGYINGNINNFWAHSMDSSYPAIIDKGYTLYKHNTDDRYIRVIKGTDYQHHAIPDYSIVADIVKWVFSNSGHKIKQTDFDPNLIACSNKNLLDWFNLDGTGKEITYEQAKQYNSGSTFSISKAEHYVRDICVLYTNNCYDSDLEMLENAEFNCGLNGWHESTLYPATVTNNQDGSIHLEATSNYGSVEPDNIPNTDEKWILRGKVKNLTGAGKISIQKPNGTWISTEFTQGNGEYELEYDGIIQAIDCGASDDINAKMDFEYISLKKRGILIYNNLDNHQVETLTNNINEDVLILCSGMLFTVIVGTISSNIAILAKGAGYTVITEN